MSGNNNHFAFIVPMHNASKTLARMLHSVYGQSYQNWHIYLIDDVSDATERSKMSKIINDFQKMNFAITTTWNEEKKWEVANVLYGLKQVQHNAIVARLDSDDYLIDLDALHLINEMYMKSECEALWTAHSWEFDASRNISAAMQQGIDPYKHPWVSSHLKTFRRYLLDNVPYENFLNQNGDIIKRAGDQAIYLPALHRSKLSGYFPRLTYHYSINEQGGAVYHTDDARFQKSEADFLRNRGYVSNGVSWEEMI